MTTFQIAVSHVFFGHFLEIYIIIRKILVVFDDFLAQNCIHFFLDLKKLSSLGPFEVSGIYVV